jgi:hypothetical protein
MHRKTERALVHELFDTTELGAAATAPCGHPGWTVIGNFVACSFGCDAVPEYIRREKTEKICRHEWMISSPFGTRCKDCGEAL